MCKITSKLTKTQKLYEQVADSILREIKLGNLLPGDKLDSVEQLAKNYDVSRSAIREALSGLRVMGVIEIRQGQGTYVAHFDPNQFTLPVASAYLMKKRDIKELSEVRKTLEVGIARLAAKNRTDDDLSEMLIALKEMKTSKEQDDLNEAADLAFHLQVAKASKNEMMISLFTSVSDVMARSMHEARKLILTKQKGNLGLYEDHVRIYEAIKQGDGSLAEVAMMSHLIEMDEVLSEYLS